MTFKRSTAIAVVVLLLSLPTLAQESPVAKPFVAATVGAMPNAYVTPIVHGEAGVELNSKHTFSRSYLAGEYARKVDTRDGTQFNAESGLYAGYPHFLLGGGAIYSHLTTSTYSKSVTRPFFGVVIRYPQATLITRAILPGTDKFNGLGGLKFTPLIPVSSHLRIRGDLGFYSFYPSNQPHSPRQHGADAAGGIEYVF